MIFSKEKYGECAELSAEGPRLSAGVFPPPTVMFCRQENSFCRFVPGNLETIPPSSLYQPGEFLCVLKAKNSALDSQTVADTQNRRQLNGMRCQPMLK